MTSEIQSFEVRCPRCGYDQRGVIAAWTDSCPLVGGCSECGLHWPWAELLSATLQKPKWCVEYATNFSNFLSRSLQTNILVWRPWRFWGTLKMSHRPVWRAVVAHIAVWVAIFYMGFALSMGALTWRDWHAQTRAAPWGAVTANINAEQYALRAMLLPLSRQSHGQLQGPALQGARPLNSPYFYFHQYWGPHALTFIMLLAIHVLSAAGFAVLPQSRRMAKVRWGHIVRVMIYGLSLFLPLMLLLVVANLIGGVELYVLLINLAVLLAMFLLIWEVAWWSAATSRYLKMPHAWAVGLAVVSIAVLTTLLLIVLMYLMNSGVLFG